MSTTEDQPAIGSPEWARALPPSAHTRSDITFGGTHVWTDDKGNIKGRIDLGDVDLTFRTPAQVRDLIGRLAALAGEMDAEITRHVRELLPQTTLHEPVDPPDPAVECSQCGVSDTPTVTGDDGEPRCYNHPKCAGRVAAREAEAAQAGAR